ncbi:GTPase activating protein [Lithohypha guttulata]|uniref:GTPase-activating protein GYP7 n=1 Tax=Lithohypha guttulata TaxID=1690604 RepID=A0AAN7SW79_9EURO|nr:GTPase activating protein [Lithohypha guttulata]
MTQRASSSRDPPSPSASFYDVSDDEEGDYSTIAHTNSGRGVKLLFSKSKVYVHPSPQAKDNIAGFIALVEQRTAPLSSDERLATSGSSQSKTKRSDASRYLLAWVPESSLAQDDFSTYVKVDLKDSHAPPKQTYLVPPLPVSSTYDDSNVGPYAFSLPLSHIYSILVRPPSIGWWFGSIVINTRSGSSLPALFFHDSECESTILQRKRRARESFNPFGEGGDLFWGGDEVVRWLKQYVNVERSTAEPSVFLIDPTEEDLVGFGQGRKSLEGQSAENQKKQSVGPGMDPLTKTLKETRWKLLENFAKITTFARKAVDDLAHNKNLPPQMRNLLQNPEVKTIQDEYDSARLYLGRWAMSIAEQSEQEKRQRIFTARDVLETEDTGVGEFEILDSADGVASDGKRRPVNMQEWKGFFDAHGRLQITEDEVKERVFHGGLDPEDGVRKEAWPFLLGLYAWNSTTGERKAQMNSLRDQYIRLKGQWWERMIEEHATPEQEEWWREQRNRIEKDVHRTDRHIPLFAGEDIPHPDPTSPFYNEHSPGTNVHMEQMKDMLLTYLEYDTPTNVTPSDSAVPVNPHPQNLGYVQGMSDLLSPLYAVFQDDALAFWCFTRFMQRMSRNFVRSQAGMRAQLSTLDQLVQLLDPQLYLHLQKLDSTNFFFFFRMLLVWYKREFEWSDVLRLWESLWTDYLSSQFHLFIAIAILEKHRDVIIDHLKGFDEVLKYINELSNTIDLQGTLIKAEALFHKFEKMVQAIDKKDNFPIAPTSEVRQRQAKGKEVIDNAKPQGASSSSDARQARTNSQVDKDKVISQDLRLLLSRKIVQIEEGADAGQRTRASGLKD